MGNLIIVRSPEAEFRPERYITDSVCNELLGKCDITEVLAGEFATLNSQTHFYDNSTMSRSFLEGVRGAIQLMADGDTVFFSDLMNPAIPVLKMHAYCEGLNVKIAGIFHSCIYTPQDFLYAAGDWAHQMEAHLLECVDEVYVATEYGRECLKANPWLQGRPGPQAWMRGNAVVQEKVKVVQFPLVLPEMPKVERRLRVVFSHRWCPEKHPQDFVKLAVAAKAIGLPHEFVVLHPVPMEVDAEAQKHLTFIQCDTRERYLQELAASTHVFSAATLETFGYSIADGVQWGLIPIVPDTACYPYLYKERFIYEHGNPEGQDSNSALNILRSHFPGEVDTPFLTSYVNEKTIGQRLLQLMERV